MRNVLADLCVESEATTALTMRLARAYDEARDDADAGEDTSDAQLFKRLATAVSKYWTCKRAPNHASEALECLGGNGYVEESGMPRLYREAPLASIWEGSGNVICLDVLRALTRSPAARGVLRRGRAGRRGGDARLDGSRGAPEGSAHRLRRRSSTAPAGSSNAWRWPAGVAAGAARPSGRRRRVLRLAARRRPRARVRHAARPGSTARPSSSGRGRSTELAGPAGGGR